MSSTSQCTASQTKTTQNNHDDDLGYVNIVGTEVNANELDNNEQPFKSITIENETATATRTKELTVNTLKSYGIYTCSILKQYKIKLTLSGESHI